MPSLERHLEFAAEDIAGALDELKKAREISRNRDKVKSINAAITLLGSAGLIVERNRAVDLSWDDSRLPNIS